MSGSAYLDYDGTQRLIENVLNVVDKAIPTGTVLSWSGSVDAVPKGWALCDGQNGTPDLRGKFVIGASENHPAGTTGGEETHILDGSLFSGGENLIISGDKTEEGSVFNALPPYYALAYIIKL